MLKQLKWNIIDFIKRYIWLYAGLFTSFVLVLILTSNVLLLSEHKQGLGLAFCILLFTVSVILSMKALCDWLWRDSVQLEMSVSVRPSLQLMGKWIFAVCISLAGLLLACFMGLLIIWHSVNIAAYLPDISGISVGIVLFLGILQFSNLLIHSSKKTWRHSKLLMVLIAIFLFLAASGIITLILVALNLWTLISGKPGELVIILNRQNEVSAAIFSVIIPLILAFGVFTGSCAVFKNKFEC